MRCRDWDWLALHGFTGLGSDFEVLSSRLPDRCHCPDLPGHGGSAFPDGGRCAFENFSNELLLRRSEPVGLIGYSLGGRLALHAAVRHPGKVRALVLIGATAGLEKEVARRERRAADETLARMLEDKGLEAFLDYWQSHPLMRTQAVIPGPWRGQMLERRRRYHLADGLAASLRCYGLGAMPPLWSDLHTLRCPVLIVAGELDEKFRHLGARLAEAIPSVRRVVLPEAGHAAHLENPPDFLRVLDSFFQEIDEARLGEKPLRIHFRSSTR